MYKFSNICIYMYINMRWRKQFLIELFNNTRRLWITFIPIVVVNIF